MYFDGIRCKGGKDLEIVSTYERDHKRPPLQRRWCVTDDRESVTSNSNKKWTEVAPKYCSKVLPIFYMDFTLLKGR